MAFSTPPLIPSTLPVASLCCGVALYKYLLKLASLHGKYSYTTGRWAWRMSNYAGRQLKEYVLVQLTEADITLLKFLGGYS